MKKNPKEVKQILEILDAKRYSSKEDKIKEAFAKKGYTLTDLQIRYLKKGVRYQFVWDIETSDFNPLGNFIISWCGVHRDILKQKPDAYVEDHITKKDILDAVDNDGFDFDKRILQTLSENLFNSHHAVGHFSTKFDMPYFRTRCLLTKQEKLVPPYGYLKQGDTWRYMKTSLKAPRNTLANFGLYTGIGNNKTYVDMKHWKRIYFPANPKWQESMDYIMVHCRNDVKQTLHGLVKAEKFNNIGSVLA